MCIRDSYRLINPDGKSQAIYETTFKDGTFSSTELSEIDTNLFSEIDYFDIAFEPTITKERVDSHQRHLNFEFNFELEDFMSQTNDFNESGLNLKEINDLENSLTLSDLSPSSYRKIHIDDIVLTNTLVNTSDQTVTVTVNDIAVSYTHLTLPTSSRV